MKKHIGTTFMMALFAIQAASGANFEHGRNSECWYDRKYNKHWGYWFCGAQAASCNKHKCKGHDTCFWQYHGDSFSYGGQKYWCCGGTKEAEGKYFAGQWIKEQKTEKKQLTNGTCNVLIKTNICGETKKVDCDTPDTCESGYRLRNKECVAPCGEDEVYESSTSNKCIKCETTVYQGIVQRGTENGCLKCDKDSEFFDKVNKVCVKKASLTSYTIPEMKSCWRCPQSYVKYCIEAMVAAVKTGRSGEALKNIDSFAPNGSPANLSSQCHLDDQ